MLADAILTHTEVGQTIFDIGAASGAIGIAAMLIGRKYIGVEPNSSLAACAISRINNVKTNFMQDHAICALK